MNYRFSGHESFPCRYAWLPKAYHLIQTKPEDFLDDEMAMVQLGVGKNMVRSIRFWVQVTNVAEAASPGRLRTTPLGKAVFSTSGFDPYLEDIKTLWLLHWKISTQIDEPLFAWDYLLNRWHNPEISRSGALAVFQKESQRLERPLSPVTLEQHFDIFIHTYVATQGVKGEGQEDNLDCPLTELELLERVGERRVDDSGRRESIYAFRRHEKPTITPELFSYFVEDFWRSRHATELTLPLRELCVGHGSPGQVLKLSEADIRERLESIDRDSNKYFVYSESSSLQQLKRNSSRPRDLLPLVYEGESSNV